MDQANLPSQGDLNNLMGAWNPMSYMQGFQNQDLASQFRDQAYQANTLANQKAGLTNTGLDIGNQQQQLGLEKTQALQPDAIAAEREKLKSQFSDEQLNQMSDQVLQDHIENIKSGDPTKIAQTGDLLDLLTGAAGKAAQGARERQLAELGVISKGNIAQGEQQTQRDVANIHAEASKYAADQANDWHKAGLEAHKNLQNAWTATFNSNMAPAEKQFRLQQIERAMQTANPMYGGAVNLPGLASGQLGRNADQGGNPPAQQKAPDAALQYLQAHPEAADQFKAKYGYLP